jgi:hypothetical protein
VAKNAKPTNSLSLDDLFGLAEEDYGSLFLEIGGVEVELLPALRLPKSQRKKLQKITDGTGEEVPEDERLDGLDVYERLFRILAATPEQGEALVNAVGERLDVYKTLQDMWMKKTQPGEVSSSES